MLSYVFDSQVLDNCARPVSESMHANEYGPTWLTLNTLLCAYCLHI